MDEETKAQINGDESMSIEEDEMEKRLKTIESFKTKSLSIIQALNEEETRRFEQYRRSHFDRALIKRIMTRTAQHTCNDISQMQPISQTMTVVMSGAAKMFVGELTLAALRLMQARKETVGPIRPRHLREAFRQYQRTKAGRRVYADTSSSLTRMLR